MIEEFDDAGTVRRLGCLTPPAGHVFSMPVFEDSIAPMSEAELLEVARSGVMDGRKFFDKTWVKNQRSHGSCNGFLAADGLAKARWRRGLRPRNDLSGAYAYSLMNGGSDNGSVLEDGVKIVQVRGICSESLVGWDQIYRNQYDTAKADADAARFKGFEVYATRTIMGTFTAAALGFIVGIAYHVGNNFGNLDSEGVAKLDHGPGNHAMHCDGLTCVHGNRLALTDENQWGLEWGQNGRLQVVQENMEETIGNHMFYAFRSTSDDPQGDNPPVVS